MGAAENKPDVGGILAPTAAEEAYSHSLAGPSRAGASVSSLQQQETVAGGGVVGRGKASGLGRLFGFKASSSSSSSSSSSLSSNQPAASTDSSSVDSAAVNPGFHTAVATPFIAVLDIFGFESFDQVKLQAQY